MRSGLARALIALLDDARYRIVATDGSALIGRITGHLGVPFEHIPNVVLERPSWEHVTLHAGVTAYLAARSPDAEWFGVAGTARNNYDMVDLLSGARLDGQFQLGAVDYVTLAAGPDRVIDAVQLGFVCTIAPDGAPVVLGLVRPRPEDARPGRSPGPAARAGGAGDRGRRSRRRGPVRP